ncbi:MAG: sulfatase family protein [Candidatus Cyclobacteriaceae bacterium M3_2C_046]
MLHWIKFLIWLVVLSLLTLTSLAQNKPNIIVILADDLGYGDLGSYGCEDIRTPSLDRLAQQGARLEAFYANGPECTPTRVALLTGRYQQRVGGLECAIGAGNVGRYDEAEWLSKQHRLGLHPEYAVLPSALKKAGYQTAIIGKWHLGYEKEFRPIKHSFDYAIGPIGYGGDFFHHVEKAEGLRIDDFKGSHNLARNDQEIFREGYYMTHLITDEAKSWLYRQQPNQPFFLYLPYTAPHKPLQGPDDYKPRPLQGQEWEVKDRKVYAEMVEEMDRGIGEILEVLERKKLTDNTLIIFFSDNGATGIGNNGIYRGIKGQVYEGGIRVPCLISWPHKIKPGTISDQVSISMDLTCSILKLADIDPEPLNLDGMDIIGHLIRNEKEQERTLFWRKKRYTTVYKAVREGPLKYIINMKDGNIQQEHLFNLVTDPAEQNDLKQEKPEELHSMRKLISNWEHDMKPEWLKKNGLNP